MDEQTLLSLVNVAELPRVYGQALGTGVIRTEPRDFFVNEIMEVEFSGNGEHLWLHIEKTGQNTADVAKHLARVCSVPQRSVGYAGRKDKHAVTRQWFSVQLPGKPDPELAVLQQPGIVVLQMQRHSQKLKTGALRGNQFELCVRNVELDETALQSRVSNIVNSGMANYFGEQRFGRGGSNISQAADWFNNKFRPKSRDRRSMLLSASRSALFNSALANSLANGESSSDWPPPEPGDWLLLGNSGGAGFMAPERQSDDWNDVEQRFQQQQLQPAIPLWGQRGKRDEQEWAKWQQRFQSISPILADGLLQQRLDMDWRRSRIAVPDLECSYYQGVLKLSMFLPPGSFATSCLRELIDYQDSAV